MVVDIVTFALPEFCWNCPNMLLFRHFLSELTNWREIVDGGRKVYAGLPEKSEAIGLVLLFWFGTWNMAFDTLVAEIS